MYHQEKINGCKSAFTLVELIVVIVILAILATIAFFSFSNQSGSARDSTRLADISSIKKSVEMFGLNSGLYPTPDSPVSITYSGGVVWNQGIMGDSVFKLISNTLSKKVKDPLKDVEYDYSLATNKKEYQVAGNFENATTFEKNYNPFDLSDFNSELSALGGTGVNVYISGNYNGVILKVQSGSGYYYVPTPTLFGINPNNDHIIVFDNSFSTGTIILPGTNNYASYKADQIFSKIGTDPLSDEEINTMMSTIKAAYSGSNITNPIVQQIVASDSNTLSNFGISFVKNSLAGNTFSSVILPASCTFSGNTVASGNPMTLYSTGLIAGTAGYDCTSKQSVMACNNGVLSGDTSTYKYTNCVKGTINNCAANGGFSFSGHTYSTPLIYHGLTATGILSANKSENNGTFSYTLNSVECNDGGYINISESAATLVSCNGGYTAVSNACVANSCATQPNYPNANFTAGSPTTPGVAWQNTTSGNACYYSCKSGYFGNDCNTLPSCAANPGYPNATFTTGSPTVVNQAWTQTTNTGIGCRYVCTGIYTGTDCNTSPIGTVGNPGTNCKTIRDAGGSTGNGLYWIDPDGAGGAASYQAYCDMTTNGGGWTMVMKIASDNTFKYASAYWTNATLLNETDTNVSGNINAKYQSWTAVVGTQIQACKDLNNGCYSITFGGNTTAYNIFSSLSWYDAGLPRSSIVGVFGYDNNEPNCNKNGINPAGYVGMSTRFGLFGNNENNCVSPSSVWGIGLNPYNSVAGNTGCGAGFIGYWGTGYIKDCQMASVWIR